jgi:hypothetical protein
VERVNNDLLAEAQSLSEQRWHATCADGVWSQGFAAYHAANSIPFITGMVQGIAEGQPFPTTTMAQIDEGNAAFHREHENCTKAETLAIINSNAPAASAMVRSLSEEQLDRKVRLLQDMPEQTVEQVIDMLLVGHVMGHLQSIRDAG